jgi:hypothetical protein
MAEQPLFGSSLEHAIDAVEVGDNIPGESHDSGPQRLGGAGLGGLGSLFAKPRVHNHDPDAREKRRLESIGNRMLDQLGYRTPHRDAAIGLALTVALWERHNGPIDSSRSQADWVIEHAQDGVGVGEPFGTLTNERARQRAKDRAARQRALAMCTHEYMEREWPDLPRKGKQEQEADSRPPSEEEYLANDTTKQDKRLRDKVVSTAKTFHYERDRQGRFKRKGRG